MQQEPDKVEEVDRQGDTAKVPVKEAEKLPVEEPSDLPDPEDHRPAA
jgi:hypothetical protein